MALRLVALLVAVAGAASSKPKVCRVLALSGGGDKGAYEAGVVAGLVQNLPKGEAAWDVVTGISAGSINAAGIATWPVGQEEAMADYLLKTARGLTQGDIYKSWPLGALQGITVETGIYDTAPLKSFITSQISSRGMTDRKLVVGATSYNTGLLETWNEKDSVADLATGVKASASIPGVFEATQARGEVFGDGGVKQGVNILDGIGRCLETTPDAANIVVDIVLCDGDKIRPVDPVGDKTITVTMRALAIMRFKSSLDRIVEAKNAYPTTTFRYEIYPSAPLPGKSDLDFDPKTLLNMTNIGIADAKKAINGGRGTNNLRRIASKLA